MIDFEKKITLANAVKPETLSFNQLISRNHIDKSELLITIATYLKMACHNTWNLHNNLTDEQSIEAASQILDNQHLTVEDVIVFIKKAKKGEFGTVYNRIDVGVIMEWFYKYDNERYEAFETQRKRERNEHAMPGTRTNNVPGLVNYEKHLKELKLK